MTIIEDTRNQSGKHDNVHAYCKANGIAIVRTKMLIGDYTLPTNQSVCIDTKQDMKEVYGNLTEYRRFHNEYMLAEELGIQLVILIEDMDVKSIDDVEHWENPIMEKWEKGRVKSKPRPSSAIATQMRTIAEKHNVRWEFCHPRDTGRRIMEILGEQQNANNIHKT